MGSPLQDDGAALRLVPTHLRDHVENVARIDGFVEHPVGSQRQRRLCGRVGTLDDDYRLGAGSPQVGQCLQPVRARHSDVTDDRVGTPLLNPVEGLASVVSGTEQRETGIGVYEQPNQLTDRCLIINH
jgi:hypothetical protein